MEYLSGVDFAIKELDALGEIEGYASTFGKKPDRQGDCIAKGAFAESLLETKGRFPLLMGHDTHRIIGFATGAEEDSHGLKIHGQLTLDADEGRNAYAIARHAHSLKQNLKLSIGYMVRENGSAWDEAGRIRTLKSIDLMEVSFVAIPANPQAMLTGIKQCAEWTKRDLEKHLRDVGYSEAAAKCIVAAGYDALGTQRDVDDAAKTGWLAQVAAIASDAQRTNFLKEF